MSLDVFEVAGVAYNLEANGIVPLRYSERLGSTPILTLQRRGGLLPVVPDPLAGQTFTWTDSGGTLRFSGDIGAPAPVYDEQLGWVVQYQCYGLRYRAEKIPYTDGYSGCLDSTSYNLDPTDPLYQASRAGRNVGQIFTDVLTMTGNANALSGKGIGQYTSLGPPAVLPSATVSDLAALTMVPPTSVTVTGNSMIAALDAFVSARAPNHRVYIQPDGTIRVLDTRSFSATTLTLGVDPIDPPELDRDVSGSFQRAEGRGQPIAEMFLFQLSNSQITEDFAWGSYTNAQAKTNWSPAQYKAPSSDPGNALDVGTCTCTSATTVQVTSSNSAAHWVANFWDQTSTGSLGVLNVWYSTGTGITQQATRRVVSNTSLTAGGTSVLTLDLPLPITSYDHYTLTGLAVQGPSIVWRKYLIADTSLWPLVTNQSTYPQAIVNAGGGASLMSTPMGVVLWPSIPGATVYNMFPCGITYAGNGIIYFAAPTYIIAGNAAPADVWVYLPINVDTNTAVYPASGYQGTSHTVEGLTETLVVNIDSWRDPGQNAQIVAYLTDLLVSVQDTVIQGSVRYNGFWVAGLTFGTALNIAGGDGVSTYPTGYESSAIPALPIVNVEVTWPVRGATPYVTTVGVSNRREHFSVEGFLRPARPLEGYSFGGDEVSNPFGLAQPDFSGGAGPAPALGDPDTGHDRGNNGNGNDNPQGGDEWPENNA